MLKDDIVKKILERKQRTLARATQVEGFGFLTGKLVHLRFRPAPASTGVIFVRTDLGPEACIAARVDNVTGTQRRTTLGKEPVQVGMVEHVLAALAGLKIDNCFVDVDAPEPPGLDGSAQTFVQLLKQAGTATLDATRSAWSVTAPVTVEHKGATLTLYPAESFALTISYFLDYGRGAPIHQQRHTETIEPASFAAHIAPCRTFLLEHEALALKQQGFGSRTKVTDLLVFGPRGPLGNTLRFADEPARHKILDIIGDLSLLGADLCGHVVAYRSGHPLNVELAGKLNRMLHGSAAPRLQVA